MYHGTFIDFAQNEQLLIRFGILLHNYIIYIYFLDGWGMEIY